MHGKVSIQNLGLGQNAHFFYQWGTKKFTGNVLSGGTTGSAGGEPTRATWSIWHRQKSCVLRVRGASGGNKTAVGGRSCDGPTSGRKRKRRQRTKKKSINRNKRKGKGTDKGSEC